MGTALQTSLLRDQIESSLARRVPLALTPAPRMVREVVPTGIGQVDALLAGGLPLGAITEIVGSACSGRTAGAYAFVSRVTRQGQVCAWIDGSDCFDAESAAANGADLARLLWVRCGEEARSGAGAPAMVSFAAPCSVGTSPVAAGGSPHPRGESRGMPEAVDAFLTNQRVIRGKKKIGTPGMSNRSLGADGSRTEQVATDRLPARRGEHLLKSRATFEPRCAAPQRRERPTGQSDERQGTASAGARRSVAFSSPSRPWHRLDQALRVTDLLLQAGGFGALVLDLGSIAPEFVNRIPPATWFRFRAAADRARTSVVLLSQHPCAQSSAAVVLRTRVAMPDAGTVMTSLPFAVEIVRQRFRPAPSNVVSMRKPPQRDDPGKWRAPASWVGGR